jgi:hypothetical protein
VKRDAEDILKEALALPTAARAALAQALRDSIGNDVNEDAEGQHVFEMARRRALKRLDDGLDLQWVPARSRDELHRR